MPSTHRIDTCTTIKHIVTIVPLQRIIEGVTCPIQIRRPKQTEILEVATKHIGNRRQHPIGAFVGIFDNPITHVVNHIDIVALATAHRIDTLQPI